MPPAVELHIDAALAGLLQQAPAAMTSNFLPRGERRLDGSEVQLRAINEGLHPAHKLARQPHIARRMAHLDHGLQLPVVGHVGVVMDGVGQRDRRLAFVALGTQAQIDAEDRPFASVAREQFGGLLGQPDEVFAVGNLRSWRFHATVVEIQQVDVGAVVQFVAAELAQRQHGKARIGHATFRVKLLRRAIAVLQLGMDFAQSFFDQHIRQSGNLGRRFRQGGHSQHIAQHDADVLALLETCQQYRRIGFERARAHAGEALLKFFARMGAVQALVADEALKQIGVVDQRLAQPGADGEHHDRVVNQERMLLQQAQHLGRGRFGQPFKLIDRCIGIRRTREAKPSAPPGPPAGTSWRM